MAQRRFHYEQAFEHYLRANRVPYVAVDEARKALMPKAAGESTGGSLKSFDFVVYAPGRSLLVDVKGRQFGSIRAAMAGRSLSKARFESWVTREDVDDMARWETLFGEGFEAVFVFTYCLQQQPPDALFEEVFTFNGRWYALREIPLSSYRNAMVERSASWGTVHLPAPAAARLSRPFSVRSGTAA